MSNLTDGERQAYKEGFAAGVAVNPDARKDVYPGGFVGAKFDYVLALRQVSKMNADNLLEIFQLHEVIARLTIENENLKKPLEDRPTEN